MSTDKNTADDILEEIIDHGADGIDRASVDGLNVDRTSISEKIMAHREAQKAAAGSSTKLPLRFSKVISRELQ